MKQHKWAKEIKEPACYTCGKPFLSQAMLQSGLVKDICDCNQPATRGQIRELKSLLLEMKNETT